MGKRLLWEPYFHRRMRSFLSVYVDDMKMARSTQHMPKMWAKQARRKSICTTQCHSLIRCILDVLNEQHKSKTDIVVEKQKVFSKLISSSTDVKIEKKNSKDIPRQVLKAFANRCTGRLTTFFGRSPCKNRRSGNGRIVIYLRSDWMEMLVFGKNWKTRFSLDNKRGKLRRAQQAREFGKKFTRKLEVTSSLLIKHKKQKHHDPFW